MRKLTLISLFFALALGNAQAQVVLPPSIELRDEGVSQGQIQALNCVGAGITCSRTGIVGTATVAGGAGGDNITVNGAAATDANFSDTTPAAPGDGVNVRWQKDAATPNNVSANLQFASASVAGAVSTAAQTFAGDKTFTGTARFTGIIEQSAQAIPPAPAAGDLRLTPFTLNSKTRWVVTDEAGITYVLARDNVLTVKAGEALTKGDVVYVSGSSGLVVIVSKFIADGSITKAPLGVMMETLALDATGLVMLAGVMGVDATGLTAGAELWASPTVLGGKTTTEPSHPDLKARLGTVIQTGPTFGLIEVESLIVRGDHEGTRLNTWKIGSNTAGAKDIVLRNGFDMTIRGNPTAARLVSLPDADSNTVQPLACSGTDKVRAISSAGVITCAADQTGAGGGFTEVEVDFGSVATFTKQVTIVDAGVAPTTKIMVMQSGAQPTGKQADEVEMDSFACRGIAASGSFALICTSLEGVTHGNHKFIYSLS